jgi:precorrin-8X/cobalt-precorrin-8 methylmutase
MKQSRESLPRGDTTENTYTDLGAVTKEAYEISITSRRLARERLGDENTEDRIRQRCAVAVGDFSLAELVRFRGDPVPAAVEALGRSAPIITDIRMVQVGILKKGHQSALVCALDHGSGIAAAEGITRSSAGFRALRDEIEGAIIVIGNAPTALLTVCGMVTAGCRPAVVIGTPVGFVSAAESKALLRTLDIPSISTEGTRGGTPVAVAAMNECITIYAEQDGRHAGPGHRV